MGLKSSIRSFGKRRIGGQPLGPPKRRRLARDFWGGSSKGGNSEKIRKRPATNVANTTLVLVPRTANGGTQWYTKNPRNVL